EAHDGLRRHVLAHEEPATARARADRNTEEERAKDARERERQRELAQEVERDPRSGRDRETEAGRMLDERRPAVRAADRVAHVAARQDVRDGGRGGPRDGRDTDEHGLRANRLPPSAEERRERRQK